LPLDLGAGLNGDDLFSDPLFSTGTGSPSSKGALIAALAGQSTPAGNAAGTETGTSISTGSTTPPAAHAVGSSQAVVVSPQAPYAAVLTVNTLSDTNTFAASTLSLREAIQVVNNPNLVSQLSAGAKAQISGTPGPNSEIVFASGLSGTVALQGALPVLGVDMTIVGLGAGSTTIDGGGSVRPFAISQYATVQLEGMTIANGMGVNSSFGHGGGAIDNAGNLTLTSVNFTNNKGAEGGGAMISETNSKLTATGCNFTNNGNIAAYGDGGAILVRNNVTVSLTGCTFTGNVSAYGGAVEFDSNDTATITGCTFTGNRTSLNSYSGDGGAIESYRSSVTLSGCTLTGNVAAYGGAIHWRTGDNTKSLQISNCTITGNNAGGGAGVYIEDYSAGTTDSITNSNISNNTAVSYDGGGISCYGSAKLTVSNTTLSRNTATYGGGIYFSANTLKMSYCTIVDNSSVRYGGGVSNRGTATIDHCTIDRNTAGTVGGGIRTSNTTTITASTIAFNAANLGGGIYSSSTLTVNDSTITGNNAFKNGGGVYSRSTAKFTNDTVAYNTAGTKGGGIYNRSTFSLYNSIVSGNTLAAETKSDIEGSTALNANSAFNLVSDTATAGGLTNGTNNNIVGSPALLGPLASNGGPTQTMLLLAGSPAMGTASTAKATAAGITVDQRGFALNTPPDMGAVQVQPAGVATHFIFGGPSVTSAGFATNFTVTAEDDTEAVVTGFTGTVHFTSSDGAATLPADYTFVAADAGVHGFQVVFNTQGTPTITATSGPVTGTGSFSVEAGGYFFLDGNHQIWLFENGTFTNTGGFATRITAGHDNNGQAELFFTDGNNEIWRFDNGQFTNLGVFATRIAAGKGQVAFTDGNNEVWIFSDASNSAAATGAFATRLVGGEDGSGSAFAYTAGNNQVFFLNGAGVSTNTGAFGTRITLAQDTTGHAEIWFTDGNNQVWRFSNGTNSTAGAFALSISGAQGGIYLLDGANRIYSDTDAGVVTFTGAFASHLAGTPTIGALFFLDGNNEIWLFQNGVGTATGAFALPGFLAAF
jgi:hypothetical protein